MTCSNLSDNFSLQEILAKLVTNPVKAINVIARPEKYINSFCLNQHEKRIFKNFLNHYGRNLKISALLLKKRRWDLILDTYHIIPKILSKYELDCYWEEYLQKIAIDEIVEKNPLKESIRFGNFLLKNAILTPIQQGLTRYEICCNQVMEKYSIDQKNYLQHKLEEKLSIHNDFQKIYPFIHPCIIKAEFSFGISTIIKKIKKGGKADLILKDAEFTPEIILFWKNWQKGGIGTLKVDENSLQLIDSITGTNNILDIFSISFNKYKIEKEMACKFLTNLAQLGLVIFLPGDKI